MARLTNLFTNVQKVASILKKNPKFDGKDFWQPIKKELEIYDSTILEWNLLDSEISNKILDLTEYQVNGHKETKINEANHFAIQQVRIPLTEECTIRKIIQIALNIGQGLALPNNEIELPVYFKKIETYISNNTIDTFSSIITIKTYNTIIQYLNKFL